MTTAPGRGLPTTPRAGMATLTAVVLLALTGCSIAQDGEDAPGSYAVREVTDGTTTFTVVTNPGAGPVLSFGVDSGIKLLTDEVDGVTVAFKDMNANGTLDAWEDWRRSPQDRAAALAQEVSIEQIAGLMLFGTQEYSPADGLTAVQETYLSQSRVRNVNYAGPNDVEATATWSNEMQAYAESLASAQEPYIPVNLASDPRSTAGTASYNASGTDLSRWPSNLGMAATFAVATVEAFSTMVSAEYRAMGIASAITPQIDLATDPRWLRTEGTFGEDAELTSTLAKVNVDGFQSSTGVDGWGPESINAMIKHWAGEGPGEGGREPHTVAGTYSVYPGGNFDTHTQAFLGALDSASVMTSYSILLNANGDPLFADRTGAAYDTGRIALLRESYDGVVVTDWNVTRSTSDPDSSGGTAWGAEDLTVDERHYAVLRTGHDMFGGNNDVGPVLAAFDLWQADYDAGAIDVDADTRFRESAARILTLMFQPGLYENAYLDLDRSRAAAGSPDKVAAGFQAQLDSAVMLKNDAQTIAPTDAADWSEATVYIPRSYATTRPADSSGAFGPEVYTEAPGLDVEAAQAYVGKVVTDEAVLDADGTVISYSAPDLSGVDVVLVGMSSPANGTHFSSVGRDSDTGGWYPLSLQYRPYTADGEHVRRVSISGDILADGSQENRSYFGATSRIENESDLDAFERAVAAVEASGRDIPVITVLKATNPVVPAEFEARSDAILVGFGISDQALIEVALGLSEPQGRLPIGFPASMDAVEAQLEDVGGDTEPYVDSAGNAYAFGFGLSYSGAITG
ncbi:glycoside hydrolase family 3 N-terminal domain-containing protein [Sanguibacter suarezii]|uniref:glycoside hydrolase family 3 N-terminal domain-containing protein n=1 Tax=Sanguibacter suarezii TaxID=60921 RepID=UPI000A950ED9|nr:glycoside hydrolase family 3 N-terminal domain-containing protein [Sanguibacter suarezii]